MRRIILTALVLMLLLCAAAFARAEEDISFIEIFNTATPAPTPTPEGYIAPPVTLAPTQSPVPTASPRFEADGSVLVTITALGDYTIGRNVQSSSTIFEKEMARQGGDINFMFRNVRDILAADDLTIINFEGVLANDYTIPASKRENKFLFLAPPEYVKALVNASVEVATIENNHIDDFGADGRASTQKTLADAGVIWADEYNMAEYTVQGVRIAMLSYKTFDYYDTLNVKVPREVAAARETHDVVIVSFHWGAEKDYYPNANQKRLAHAAVDAGADLIIGHHSHRINPIEEYNGKYIVYSVGNSSFAGNNLPDDMSTFIFQTRLRLKDGELLSSAFRIIPCRISSKVDYNDFAITPYTNELHVSNVISTLKNNGRYIENAVAEYPLDWE